MSSSYKSIIDSYLTKYPNLIVTTAGCDNCKKAIKMLDEKKVNYKQLSCEEAKDLVEAMKHEKNHTGYPIIFINSEFVGGCE